jgi:hypothetical protein
MSSPDTESLSVAGPRTRRTLHRSMALGIKVRGIQRFFKTFTDFSYTTGRLRKIAEGGNGVVHELTYRHKHYKAHAVLKSCRNADSVNLAYEYIVGDHFVNRMTEFFPCFIHTYGLFRYNSVADHTAVVNGKVKAARLSGMLTRVPHREPTSPDLLTEACRDPHLLCTLLEHMHDSRSIFEHLLAEPSNEEFVEHELIKVLFIVYHALHTLKTNFTHYDLNYNNVLLYSLPPGHAVEYQYTYPGRASVVFRCRFIPKIIDYGYCFFDFKGVSSDDVKREICRTRECHPCEQKTGLGLLTTDTGDVPTRLNNVSADLKLLHMLKEEVKDIQTPMIIVLQSLLKKVVFEHDMNTPERTGPGGDQILNVTDAYHQLLTLVTTWHDPIVDHVYATVPSTIVVDSTGRTPVQSVNRW